MIKPEDYRKGDCEISTMIEKNTFRAVSAESSLVESIRNAGITCGECEHYSEPTVFNMYRACGEGVTRYCWGQEWGIDKDFFCAHHSKLEKK